MIFIKYPNGNYWELNIEKMRSYNIHNGWHKFDMKMFEDKTIKQLITDKVLLICESWHDLYLKTKFNPLVSNEYYTRNGWISPEGDFYSCDAHEIDAKEILKLLYGIKYDYYSDKLIDLGWIKVTTSAMFAYYKKDGHYNKMTQEQKETFKKWYNEYKRCII